MPELPLLHGETVDVPTPDGTADAYFVRRSDEAPRPAVLLFMDGIGLRPRLEEMADRIAAHGYAVLVPNLFYRAGRAPVVPDLASRLRTEDRGSVMAELRPLMSALTPEVAARDTQAYVDFLDQQAGVQVGPLGTTGYCMGGALSLRAAAQLQERVTAAASFHGGNLAPDDPAGVHQLAPRIRAEVYVAHADNDASAPPEQQQRLAAALEAAGVQHTAELYAGASHGFTMSDMAVYDAAAEQRHWDALLGLLARNLPA
ncbi:MAG: carboxymethylenebutenolidase [Actinomycetota bacterium]|jgi:carboxymethylenebutenolidase|nr:carboxymethylenebutenolidase [Actinomycetota bacterium]